MDIGVLLLCAVAVLLPLAMDPFAAVAFALPKAEILSVLACAIGVAAIVRLSAQGSWTARLLPVHLLVLAYLGAVAASAAFGVDLGDALWGAYDRRFGLVATLQLGLIYFGAATFIRTERAASLTLMAAAVAGVIVLVYEIAQAIGLDPLGWSRAQFAFATLGNSNVLSQYMAILSAAGGAALFGRFAEGVRARALVVPAMLCAAFALGMVIAQGRAALLGFGAGALFALVVTLRRVVMTKRGAVSAAGLVAATVLAGAILLTIVPSRERIVALFNNDRSVTSRASIYTSMLTVLSDRPFLGVGPDNVAVVYNAYRRPESVDVTTATNTSAHGWPWRIAAEGGALGLASFALLLVGVGMMAATALRRTLGWSALALSTVVVTYLVSGLFTVDHLGTAWMFWLAAGALVGLAAGPPSAAGVRTRAQPPFILLILLAAGVLWPLAALVNDIGASRAIHASRAPGLSASQALDSANRGVEGDARWASHWTNLGQRALAAGDRALALRGFAAAAERAPYDPFVWRNLGTMQAQSGDPAVLAEARESARRALVADPHNPEAAAAAAQVYVLAADGAAAVPAIEKALVSSPRHPPYLELAAQAYRLSGRLAEARVAIESALREETPQRRYVLAEILISQRDFPGARTQLHRVLQLDSGDPRARSLLAELDGR